MKSRVILGLAAALGIGACSDVPTNPAETPQRPDLILYGAPDGNEHPYVGLLLFYVGDEPAWLCTGSLLDAHTVLTAGHCTFGATEAHFYQTEKPLDEFKTLADFLAGGKVGEPVTYPGYDEFDPETFPNTGDVGVVKFTEFLDGPYARLARVNGVNRLAKHQVFDIVGYGLEDVRPVEVSSTERLQGQAKLIGIRSGRGFFGPYNLALSSNSGRPHRGGLCRGDSGGPVLVGDVIFAVTSYGWNNNCTSSGFGFRVDLKPVHDWILAQ